MKKMHLLILLLPFSLFAQKGNLGHEVKYIGNGPSDHWNTQMLVEDPNLELFKNDKGRLLGKLSFTTRDSILPGKVYYGVIMDDDKYQLPRYRFSKTEKGY